MGIIEIFDFFHGGDWMMKRQSSDTKLATIDFCSRSHARHNENSNGQLTIHD
jgi:hypothetical protein